MTLPLATVHQPRGAWPTAKAAGTVTLDFDARHRRRIRLTTDTGEDVILDLASAVAMSDGDGLGLEDGRWIEVRAADEAVVEVRHPDVRQLVRLAWHLGNRHLPTQIEDTVLRIRPDHVIEAMLQGLGADLMRVHTPFQPEGGAYSHGGDPGHGHAGTHSHAHGDHAHAHDDGHSHGHGEGDHAALDGAHERAS